LYYCGFIPSERRLWFNKVSNARLTDEQYVIIRTHLFADNNKVNNRSILRKVFQNTPFNKQRVTTSHTHPDAAGERNSQIDFFSTVARDAGLKLYIEQASAADQRKGLRGARQFYWPKDFTTTPQEDKPHDGDLVCFIDVDYHVDMPRYLAKCTHPVIIYTIQPTAVAGTMHDTVFTFENNEIVTSVAGGASFRHKLWNYGEDHLICKTYECDEFISTTFLVERLTISPHRQIVLLVPIAHFTGLAAQLSHELGGKPLKALEPQPVGHPANLISSLTPEGHFVSVGLPGSYQQATITQATYGDLRAAANNVQQKLTAATVESYLSPKSDQTKGQAQILTAHLRAYVQPEVTVNVVNESIVHYVANPKAYDHSANKRKAVALWQNIVPNKATAPLGSLQNDKRCVASRVTNIQHKAPLKMTPFLRRVINEFVDLMVPYEAQRSLVPVSVEAVYQKQSRPTQHRTLDLASTLGPYAKQFVKAFQKNEVSGKLSDPRNISTLPARTKLDYSQFYYAVSDFLKTKEWYTFGKTPKEVSFRVADICSRSDTMSAGDFSRMDGRVSSIGRTITSAIMLALFPDHLHEELKDLMSKQINATCFTTHGVKYNSGTTRLSGSPETSGHNTLENAFTAYYAYRSTHKPDGTFYSPKEAWAMLNDRCEFGGDDSLMGDMPERSYAKAAKDIGHQVTCDVFKRGDPGINFLSRIFGPDVWTGDPNNMCDLARQMVKFNCTTDVDAKPATKFTEKAMSCVFTDANTPIIGRYSILWLNLNKVKVPTKLIDPGKDVSWWSANFELIDQFINLEADWMTDVAEKHFPGFDWEAFNRWQPLSPDEMLNAPSFSEPVDLAPPTFDLVAEIGDEAEALYAPTAPSAPPLPISSAEDEVLHSNPLPIATSLPRKSSHHAPNEHPAHPTPKSLSGLRPTASSTSNVARRSPRVSQLYQDNHALSCRSSHVRLQPTDDLDVRFRSVFRNQDDEKYARERRPCENCHGELTGSRDVNTRHELYCCGIEPQRQDPPLKMTYPTSAWPGYTTIDPASTKQKRVRFIVDDEPIVPSRMAAAKKNKRPPASKKFRPNRPRYAGFAKSATSSKSG